MKQQYEDVKKAIYSGMSIFDVLKNLELKIYNKEITEEDKKYLSLYLGIIYTKNEISDYIKSKEIKFNLKVTYKLLEQSKYIELYNNYFVNIFDEIDFNSLTNYFNYLLSKDIIQSLNKSNGHYVDITINNKNKELIKK